LQPNQQTVTTLQPMPKFGRIVNFLSLNEGEIIFMLCFAIPRYTL
jgi:hypothetical protein